MRTAFMESLPQKSKLAQRLPIFNLGLQQAARFLGRSILRFCYLRSMSRAPSFCAVILAAGDPASTDTDKALRPWPPASAGATQSSGQTLLSTSIAALNRFADMVLVVTGTGESALAPVVYASGGVLVQNPDYAPGFFSALQVGLREVLNRGRDAAILTLVDKPPVRGATLKTLLAEFENAVSNEKWAAVPEYQGVQGYPLLLGRE